MKSQTFLIVPVIILFAVLSFTVVPASSTFAANDAKMEAAQTGAAPGSMHGGCDKPCCQKKHVSACCKEGKAGDCCQKHGKQHCQNCDQHGHHGKHANCANCEEKAHCKKCGHHKGEGKRHCDKPCKTVPCGGKQGTDKGSMDDLFEKDKS